ncbi:3-deoxy-D-manno-octulosonic acid kinase [Marinobacter sp. F4216]|uniref:3-deoxy-D-manno-octulosonic acid kinase n=1 Tax=Marinobacter sp. F4216 TaxID=2874281 RepID=UPI001CBDDD9C|nr:3-deoxy-D-manno-octulosonic acid kinase [Marinobacter sp. F4216]MBZ2170178.1 3-deoxy-D-manno-octulosonic acid kinase [Marinobacter sp. F4216]
MGKEYIKHIGATGGYLVAPSFEASFEEGWFDPDFWGDLADPVSKGGRGAAWFIHAAAGDLLLRHFCRGGLPGRFLRRDYVYTRVSQVRSFVEFRLLRKLYSQGLPVPEPIAAGYQRHGSVFYHASILMRRIPNAIPLSDHAGFSDMGVWQDAGACIRRFHDVGVYHADLNCMNILVSDQIYLIDFDRGRIISGGKGSDWKKANINRLKRSVEKLLGHLDASLREQLWESLLSGYRR